MKTKSKNLFKIFLLLVCVLLALSLVACSERQKTDEVDPDKPIGGDDNKVQPLTMSQSEAFAYIKESMQYLDQEVYVDPEWLCINTMLEFQYHSYEKSGATYTTDPKQLVEYSLSIMANISLKDNSQSVVFIELSDINKGAVLLGLYYYSSTTYVSIGTKKFYTEQINMTRIGQELVSLLKMGTADETDIPEFIGNALQANIDIDAIKQYTSIIWMVLFNSEYVVSYSDDKYTYTDSVDGREQTVTVPKYQYINEYLNADMILGMISSGRISLLGVIDIELSWEAFGLPNLDHILQDTIGFGLVDIIEKDWPSVTFALKAITEMQPVVLPGDKRTGYKYVFNGIGIDITTDTGEFDVFISATPFVMEVCNEKRVSISLAGYNLGEGGKGTTYTEGSLTNIEANMQIAVDNDSAEDDVLTLTKLMGNILDLGAIGEIPIVVGGGTSYVLDLGIAASLDLFDNSNNYAKIKLGYNDREVFAVYLVPDLNNTVIDGGAEVKILNTIYFDFHNLKSGGQPFLPNTKLSALDLTKSLSGLIGEEIMTFIDPYRGDTTASRNAASNASSVEITEPLGVDVMALIELLISEKARGRGRRYFALRKRYRT